MSARCGGHASSRRVPTARPADLPGSVRDPESAADDLRFRERTAGRQSARLRSRRARSAGAGGDGRGGASTGRRVRAPLSARAVGWPAPARRDRRRARHGARAHRGRRARLDAGRLDPDGAAAPDAGPASRARADVPVHHPRPVARLGDRRPDRGHVPRQDHGDRAGRVGHPRPAQPLHAGARVRVAVTRSTDRRRACPADDPQGRDAGRRAYPGRVPLQPALPEGLRPVPGRGAAADRRRWRAGGGLLAGRAGDGRRRACPADGGSGVAACARHGRAGRADAGGAAWARRDGAAT